MIFQIYKRVEVVVCFYFYYWFFFREMFKIYIVMLVQLIDQKLIQKGFFCLFINILLVIYYVLDIELDIEDLVLNKSL